MELCRPQPLYLWISLRASVTRLFVFLLAAGSTALDPCHVSAGLGPENVFVVVNGDEVNSLTVANHYTKIREIPPSNVFVLDDVPSGLTVSLEGFRDRILKPILDEIDQRKLSRQIRAIAYSAGFPTGVNIASHTAQLTDPNAKRYQTAVASLNSLTFFYRFVLSDSPQYLGWGSNLYARGPFGRNFANPLGGEKGDVFGEAQDALDSERFEEAAEKWSELADEFPSMAPLQILAAEASWQSDDRNEAVRRVGLAVKSGWTNRQYLKTESPLATLFEGETPSGGGALSKLLASMKDVPAAHQGPVGFAGDVGWASNGYPVPLKDGGVGYMLSTMLAVVHPNGSTIEQAVDYLKRAAASDRTFPDATVGFSKTGDVRTKTRFPLFGDALSWLLSRDRDVAIFSGKLPSDTKSYVGLMLGTPQFDVLGRRWSIVPGGIAENLTSTGAVFAGSGQTKCTELLHAGAAMSSGAVAEPYSIPMKFPSPLIHPYYFEGVTAAEAFYLTTSSPYQLLIIGDPLAQPFARAPAAEFELSMDENLTPDGRRVIRVERQTAQQAAPAGRHSETLAIELYIQDRLVQRLRPVREINFRIPANTFGPVRCRVVAVGNDPTEPRIGFSRTFVLGSESKLPKVQTVEPATDDRKTSLKVSCAGAESIDLQHFGRTVATIQGDQGEVKLSRQQIGDGPVPLQAIGRKGNRALLGPIQLIAR
ncbi:MAG: hypothetical protein AAF670_09225 [Planctomycetota bacterium]